jgi:hypothetical protein
LPTWLLIYYFLYMLGTAPVRVSRIRAPGDRPPAPLHWFLIVGPSGPQL